MSSFGAEFFPANSLPAAPLFGLVNLSCLLPVSRHEWQTHIPGVVEVLHFVHFILFKNKTRHDSRIFYQTKRITGTSLSMKVTVRVDRPLMSVSNPTKYTITQTQNPITQTQVFNTDTKQLKIITKSKPQKKTHTREAYSCHPLSPNPVLTLRLFRMFFRMFSHIQVMIKYMISMRIRI